MQGDGIVEEFELTRTGRVLLGDQFWTSPIRRALDRIPGAHHRIGDAGPVKCRG
jgi:hypothetical protein